MRYLLITVFAMGIVACHTPDPENAASHPPHHGVKGHGGGGGGGVGGR